MQKLDSHFDLMFIGGGVSSLYTLVNLAENLRSDKALQEAFGHTRLRIGLVEQSPGCLGGIPYTGRSAYTSLLITSLRDFLPDEERILFANWLDKNAPDVFEPLHRFGGALSKKWIRTHEREIANGEWADLYLPRYLFGMYMNERVCRALRKVDTLCEFQLIRAEVTDVVREGNDFRLETAAKDRLKAKRIVLAIGSTPNRPILKRSFTSSDSGVCLINDPYDPGLDHTLDWVEGFLHRHPSPSPDILIVGGAASTMDVLYSISDRLSTSRRVRFCILSPNGKLPDKIEHSMEPNGFIPAALQSLFVRSSLTARQVFEAAQSDIELGKSKGLSTSDTLIPISGTVTELVKRLSAEEKWEFSNVWGSALGRLQRRSGPEYSDLASELNERSDLTVLEGRFQQIANVDASGATVEIHQKRAAGLLAGPFAVIINCAGFASLSGIPSNCLLQRLLSSGLVRPTANLSGLQVNNELEASPAFYVIGPLLAGNVVNSSAIWHMEHCGRISRFARNLADTLHSSFAELITGQLAPLDAGATVLS